MVGATLYVGGLARGTDQAALALAYVPQRVVHAVVSRSFGFVTFATVAEAETAVTRLDVVIGDRTVHAALRHSGQTPGEARTTAISGRSASSGGGSSVFVHCIGRQTDASSLQAALAEACLALGVAARVVVPRKQGVGHAPQHRGFAFLECSNAGDVAGLLAGLPASGWSVEAVRKKRGKADKRGKRGKRGGNTRGSGRRSVAGDRRGSAGAGCPGEEYEEDWEEEGEGEDEAVEVPATDAPPAAAPISQISDAELRSLLADARGASDEWNSGTDPCVAALASFVSESREWALCVQGFMVEHCREFEATEENRLEWYELHRRLTTLMEAMLERELGKLGVAPEDFVDRMRAACASGTVGGHGAAELLEAVLAMDDFGSFKAQMLRLKADLSLMNLGRDTLDTFATPAARER